MSYHMAEVKMTNGTAKLECRLAGDDSSEWAEVPNSLFTEPAKFSLFLYSEFEYRAVATGDARIIIDKQRATGA